MEYVEDKPMKDREENPDYLKWVLFSYFESMERKFVEMDLGKPPSDEEQAQARFRIGWSSQVERAKANAFEDEETNKIKGLLRTHVHTHPCR